MTKLDFFETQCSCVYAAVCCSCLSSLLWLCVCSTVIGDTGVSASDSGVVSASSLTAVSEASSGLPSTAAAADNSGKVQQLS